MAITKKFKVSFDVTVKLGSEEEAAVRELIRETAKKIREAGPEYRNDFKREMLIHALTNGPDGAIEFLVRKGLRGAIKEMRDEMADKTGFKFSPATVRVVK